MCIRDRRYDGKYGLTLNLNDGVKYDVEKCYINIVDSNATINLDYTNGLEYSLVSTVGTGTGILKDKNFVGNGNVVMKASLKSPEIEQQFDVSFSMHGTMSEYGVKNKIEGDFVYLLEGSPTKGTFMAMGTGVVRLRLIRGNAKLLRSIGRGWQEEVDGLTMLIHDKLYTDDENTRVDMIFNDGSVFHVKSNTIVTCLLYTSPSPRDS